MHDWTRDFFTEMALDTWQRSRSLEETLGEVSFLEEVLELGEEPRRVLDVPCGDGRHAVELARRGHAVTGIDRAPDNRRRLAERAGRAGVAVEFVLGDMRELPANGPFDGAYCLGNSFGYFPRADTERFVQRVAGALAPGGSFVIDTACAAESILIDLEQRSWQRVDDGLVVLLECEYDARESRLDTTYTALANDQVVDTRTAHNYIFTCGEIVAMLDGVGLQTRELWSDLGGSPFELGSERLLLIAERASAGSAK